MKFSLARSLILSLFLVLAFGAQAAKRIECKKLFEFVPVKEIKTEGTKLGEGENAVVRVFTNSKGEKYVIKTYKSKSSHRNSQIQFDLRAFKYLATYRAMFSFTLPEFSLLSENQMKLSYHPGRTVLDLLTDKSTKPDVKKKIEASYKKLMDEIESHLHDFHHVEKTPDKLSAENDSLAMGDLHLIIKKDNVIVDPETLKLTLIDPQ